MAWFYGWTHDEIMSLSVDDFDSYWSAIQMIESQVLLKDLSVMDWPHQKQSFRETKHRQLFQSAYPDSFNGEKKAAPVTELAKLLKG